MRLPGSTTDLQLSLCTTVKAKLTLRLLMSYIYIYIYIYDISSLRVNNLTLILLNVEKMMS